MSLELRVVRPDGLDRPAFDGLPAQVYAADPNWAPQASSLSTDLWQDAAAGDVDMHPVMAQIDGASCVARAAAIVPAGADDGWIGLIECLPGHQRAGILVIDACRRWLQATGVRTITAPQTSGMVYGLLSDGFDRPQSFLTPYNPPWYADILELSGFHAYASMVAYEFTRSGAPQFPANGDIAVRSLDMDDLMGEVTRIHAFQETVFVDRPGRRSRGLDQTRELASRLLPVVDPDLVVLAVEPDGGVIGVLICVPDAWERRATDAVPTRARLISAGVAARHRGRGVATAMGAHLARHLLAKGYQSLEASVVMGDNAPPQDLVTSLGARVIRRFEVYRYPSED
jgi:ribosomal protein S18 acetylase RimI-like enzyme